MGGEVIRARAIDVDDAWRDSPATELLAEHDPRLATALNALDAVLPITLNTSAD